MEHWLPGEPLRSLRARISDRLWDVSFGSLGFSRSLSSTANEAFTRAQFRELPSSRS
jgi:hypothetical protein